MVLKSTELFLALLLKVVNKVNVFPWVVIIKDMTPEALTLFAKFHTCITTYETVVFKIIHYG